MTYQLRPYQQRAIDQLFAWLTEHRGDPCLVLPTGCHDKGQLILMHSGELRPVEDVAIGDKLMGPDGSPRTVLRLCRGHDEMFVVRPIKGTPWVVNGDHILSLKSTNEGKDFPGSRTGGEVVNISVRDYLLKSKSWKHLHKLYRSEAVEFGEHPESTRQLGFDARRLALPPRFVGMMIGDGSFISMSHCSFTSMDRELLDYVRGVAGEHGTKCTVQVKPNNRAISLNFAKNYSGKKDRNVAPLCRLLRDIGCVGHNSETKRIPDAYKRGTVSERLELLAGLIDTDGHLSGGGFDYITKSQGLANDIAFVCRSLGLVAPVSRCRKRCQTGVVGTYYRVSISGDCSIVPVLLDRKRSKARKQKKRVGVTGFSVEPVGFGDFFGFELDGDHLYLLDDFTVTHNSGKSLIVAEICRSLVQEYPEVRLLMLTHVKELLEQNAEKLRSLWPGAPMGIYSAGLNRRELGEPITFASVQSVAKRAQDLGVIDICIIDEAHLVGHNDEGSYRNLIRALREINPRMRVIGLTATPYRMGHGLITDDPAIFDDLIEPTSIEELLALGFLAPLKSRITKTHYDLSEVHKRGGEYIESELASAVDTKDQNSAVIDEVIAWGTGKNDGVERKSWLFFCSGVEHANHVRDELLSRGILAATITGDTPSGERKKIIDAFKRGTLRALTNNSVLTTGFDHPDIDLIAMMRPTTSPGLYCLDSKTQVLTPNGWASMSDDISTAAAFSVDDGSVMWSSATKVVRKRYQGERMFSIGSSHQDIRVTASHRMVVKTRKTGFRLINADNLFQEQSIPCAGVQPASGSGLTRDELIFLGLFMSDGTVNKKTNALQISQGKRHDWIVDEIRRVIVSCGMKFSERVIAKAGSAANLGERKFDQLMFSISKGKPRGIGKELRGWGYLEKWVSKKNLSAYESLTREELIHFLHGLNMGDGAKMIGVNYTPGTYRIAMGSSGLLADQMQSLCARRGMRTVLSLENNCYILYVSTEKGCRSLLTRSSDSRPVFSEEGGWIDEFVWCVEVSTGAIITRRNGKVSVVGNCQMGGRGLRLKKHINHCLVLDFAGVVEAHGPITSVRMPEKGAKKEAGKSDEKPTKPCPECHELLAISARSCECGYQFPEPEKPQLKLRDDDIMGKEGKRADVSGWNWVVHTGKGSGIQMLRVNYETAELTEPNVSEYFTIKHEGKGGEYAWRKLFQIASKSGVNIRTDFEIQELADRMSAGQPPSSIEYARDGKFFRVLKRDFAPIKIVTPEELSDDDIPF